MNKIIIKQIHKDKEVRIALLFDYDKNINECQSKKDIRHIFVGNTNISNYNDRI